MFVKLRQPLRRMFHVSPGTSSPYQLFRLTADDGHARAVMLLLRLASLGPRLVTSLLADGLNLVARPLALARHDDERRGSLVRDGRG